MAQPLRIVLNRAGVRQLLNSPEVLADIAARSQRIAQRAGEGFTPATERGRNRVRGSVRTASRAARLAEAKQRALTQAINAGR